MTRKHYQALANALANATDLTDARERIADVMAADNPRFDRTRFLAACDGDRNARNVARLRKAG